MQPHLEILTGAALAATLPALAQLRIDVFSAFPYLYDGDLAYEQAYLQNYSDSSRAIVVAAFDADRLIGAATGTPLTDHEDDFAAAFAQQDLDLTDIFYCAESVLLQQYRGQGLGHRFFEAREAHARLQGFGKSTFCSVLRPADHPSRPHNYTPLDAFWRKRGYAPLQGAVAQFAWKDLGDASESNKSLQFWIRDL